MRVLGLFPALDLTGGIEESGRLAWSAVANEFANEGSVLECYGGCPPDPITPCLSASSKPGVLKNAWTARAEFDLVLIWHIGMLKVLPFACSRAARVRLFLHGREVWKPQRWPSAHLLRRVDGFITNSDHTWGRFLKAHPELEGVKHETVPLGWGSPVELLSPPASPPTAVMIGRLGRGVDYKGHSEIISVWPRVQERVPGARLWIVGEGEGRVGFEASVPAELKGSIRFWGRLPEEDKAALIRQSSCLLLPSKGEGFGLVYLEAMRQGRPCLVSDEDAGREVVDPPAAGLSCSPSDTEGLIDAIARLLTPGSRWDEWSITAKERYDSNFTAAAFQMRLVRSLRSETLGEG